MKFEIIRANEDLADDLGYIHAKSWQKAYRGIVPDEIINTYTPENRAKVFKEAVTTRPEECYLFKCDGRPAGLALLHKSHEDNADENDGEIYAIYFHPDFWGTPATHKALEFCIGRLRERGFTKINIWMLEDNLRARKFYEKHGFAFDGRKKTIDLGKQLVEIRYSRSIS